MEPFQNHQVIGEINQSTASKQLYHSSWRGTLKTTTFIKRGEIIKTTPFEIVLIIREYKMKLIFIRHGDPNYKDDTLTERGWREAKTLSKRVVKWKVDKFYCSPLGRAQDTAGISLNLAGRTAETKDWLREFHANIIDPHTGCERIPWDFMPSYWTNQPELYDKDYWHETDIMKTGAVSEEYRRVCSGIDGILAEYGHIREGSIYTTEQSNEKTIVFFLPLGCSICYLVTFIWNICAYNVAKFLCRSHFGNGGCYRGAPKR